jgi:hypothetical protein
MPTTSIVYAPGEKGLPFGADRRARRFVAVPGFLGAMPIKSQSDGVSVYPRFNRAMTWDTAAGCCG